MNQTEDDDFDFWRLCDELSIQEAALLVAGESPGKAAKVEEWEPHERPRGYEAAKSAIRNALRKNAVAGTIILENEWDIDSIPYGLEGTISLQSRVEVESLRSWLRSRGLNAGFFFPTGSESADYLDTQNSRYAPKLAAAVMAWKAVTDPAGKHPKQALAKWLREHASDFGLTDEDGKPNETGIEEAAKVANWQPGGGAPKTPNSPQD